MIQDGVVVYDARKTSFRDWQFDSEILNVIVLAILTTILAYQLSAICYNIFLGCKVKGRATASDFHKLILTETSSPLAILAAIARLDTLDRLRFRGDIPRNVRIARRDTKVSARVALSLIALLLVAPLCNLISIFIVLQQDERVTFSQAKFGGLALGVGPIQVEDRSQTDFCQQVPLQVVGPATSVVQFTMCFLFEIDFNPPKNSTGVRLTAETTLEGQIKVSVTSLPSNVTISIAIRVDLASDGQLLRTKPIFSLEDAGRLVHNGQERLANICSSATPERSPHSFSSQIIEQSRGLLKASKDFQCKLQKTEDFVAVIFKMTKEINVIEQKSMMVARAESLSSNGSSLPEYFDAGPLPFIVRRTRKVNLLILLILLCVSIICRMVTGFLFNNDIDEGLEAVVRHRLGIAPQESMLKNQNTIKYNSKGQDGRTAHYGLRRSALPEVEQFEVGIEIGMGDRKDDEEI